jgi:hypothetical protein
LPPPQEEDQKASEADLQQLDAVGRFYVDHRKVPVKHIQRLQEIAPWYTDDRTREVLLPVVMQTSEVSLRVLDWFVTNYTKRYRILAEDEDAGFHTIATLYKHWLRHYRRKLFDPFRRRERIFFRHPDDHCRVFCTTCAQVNFLKWCETYGVLSQARKYRAEIEADMIAALQAARGRKHEGTAAAAGAAGARAGATRKRTELTPTPPVRCQVYLVDHRMRLDLTPQAGSEG